MSQSDASLWEYEVISLSEQLADAVVKAALDDLGGKGWELVGIHAGAAQCPRYVFKRRAGSAGSEAGVDSTGGAGEAGALGGLGAMTQVGSPDDEEDRRLRNASMAEALMALPLEKQEKLFAEVLTDEERQMPSPPDDFYERVMLYFSMHKNET